MSAKVGWFGGDNPTKAICQEKGFITSSDSMIPNKPVPPRPFIEPSIIDMTQEGIGNSIDDIKSGNTSTALKKIGDKFKEKLQQKIDQVVSPKLKDSTKEWRAIRGKYIAGIDKPLIETGSMRNSIEVRVGDKNK